MPTASLGESLKPCFQNLMDKPTLRKTEIKTNITTLYRDIVLRLYTWPLFDKDRGEEIVKA